MGRVRHEVDARTVAERLPDGARAHTLRARGAAGAFVAARATIEGIGEQIDARTEAAEELRVAASGAVARIAHLIDATQRVAAAAVPGVRGQLGATAIADGRAATTADPERAREPVGARRVTRAAVCRIRFERDARVPAARLPRVAGAARISPVDELEHVDRRLSARAQERERERDAEPGRNAQRAPVSPG